MSDAIIEARKLLQGETRRLAAALKDNRSRSRAPLVRRMHETRQMLLPTYAYISQAGQDFVVDQIMRNKRGGTFVDIGGYDGVTGSNTYFLETHRGWTGALVEPVPTQLTKAQAARACPCVGIAIAPKEGEAEFIEISEGYTQMSGLVETYDEKLLGTVRSNQRHRENMIKVQTKTLSGFLQETGLIHPDFISLDIEGGEIDCLSAFPFGDHNVQMWSIENNTGSSHIKQIMTRAGYDLVEFCGPDEIYARSKA